MASQLHHVLTVARALSPRDKLELLQALSDDLQDSYSFAEATEQFWHLQSLDDILSAQAAPVITDVHMFEDVSIEQNAKRLFGRSNSVSHLHNL